MALSFVDASAPKDPLIIDGTYLQFCYGNEPEDALHILIAHASETPPLLERALVEPWLWYQWRPDMYPKDVFFDTDERQGLNINS